MANNELNLLPCPFCGGANLSTDAYSVQPDDFHSAHVDCDACEARGPNALTVDGWLSSKEEASSEAGKAWNRRATPAQAEPSDALPKWIDDQKGKDPTIDALIEYIERIRGQQGGSDAARLDKLEELAESAYVGMCFEIDGGVHMTIEAPSSEPVAYRNMNSIRDALDAAIQAQAGDAPMGGA